MENTWGSPIAAGDVLAGRYRIVQTLGRGGTSVVYEAEDLKLPGKRWAVKELRIDDAARANARREADILIRLDHPRLPKIVDFFHAGRQGHAYLVMDLIRGDTLQERFERLGKPLPVADVLRYTLQLTELLHDLHERSDHPIVYRDLKPANVMIDDRDQVRLIDFGIARRFGVSRGADTVKLGTVGFAAPEQYDGRASDPRTDMYALGAMMYYLLSGGLLYEPVKRPLSEAGQDVPPELARIVMRLLRRDPQERYPSARALQRDLSAAAGALAGSGGRRSRQGGEFTGEVQRFYTLKTVLVGSFYCGAGATFLTFAMSGSLRSLNIPHAVVEWPGSNADHYTLLDGDRRMPDGFRFWADRMAEGAAARIGREWRTGSASWVPLPPGRVSAPGTSDALLRLMHSLNVPLVLVDVACRWCDEDIEGLAAMADAIVVVAGSDLARLQRPSIERFASRLNAWSERGKPVHYAANRSGRWRGRAEWLDSFPCKPVCEIPDFPGDEIRASVWNGSFAAGISSFHESLSKRVRPLTERLLMELKIGGEGRARAWYKKFFG